jgi:AraC family transcriptional regulator
VKVMVIVKATRASEAGEMPSQEVLTAMGTFNEELIQAGIMLAGEGLQPSSQGARVRFRGAERTVVEGPFPETNALIAGFWMWRVPSMQEAIDWAKRCPNPPEEEWELEIRRVSEAEDFGESFSPELREQEASQRAQTLGLGAVRFENLPELRIAGTNARYTLQTRDQIPSQWCEFTAHLGNIPGRVGQRSYGISRNLRPGCEFDYLCGVEVASPHSVPAHFQQIQLPARRYAKFSHDQHVSQIAAKLDAISAHWGPDCGLQLVPGMYIECYTEAFEPETGQGGIEIWLPLEAA